MIHCRRVSIFVAIVLFLSSCSSVIEPKGDDGSAEVPLKQISPKPVEHCTILCAKEVIKQGKVPTYEWFLLGEPGTNNLYATRDFSQCTLLTPFGKDLQQYCL